MTESAVPGLDGDDQMQSVPWAVDERAQQAFSELSGDHNPIHVDPIAARRLPFGRVAVHGVHQMLWALDTIVDRTGRSVRSIHAKFKHSVGVGDQGVLTWSETTDGEVRAELRVDVWAAMELRLILADSINEPLRLSDPLPVEAAEPVDRDLADVENLSGTTPVRADAEEIRARFPSAVRAIGEVAVAECVTLTRLVGMEVPGLRSLFIAMRLDVTPVRESGDDAQTIIYRVTRADERFSRVAIDVTGSAVTGSLTALIRPRPVDQAGTSIHPSPDVFRGVRALVIGGSRGLGRVAVDLLVQGGAEVRFTYRIGRADAEQHENASAISFPFDTSSASADIRSILRDGWSPTLLAYFASPPIFVGGQGVYSNALHARFRAVYVDAFTELVDTLVPVGLRSVLWPSSEAVLEDVPGMAEYTDAKRSGEQRCRELADRHPGLVIATPRYPRLLTDQSTSFIPTEFGDTGRQVFDSLLSATNGTV